MKRGISGVYKITNLITGEFYIGASVDVDMRWSTHVGRDARKYQNTHRFYKDIIEFGKENFELVLLKECPKDELLKWEQYYYDKLKPTYNKVRPVKSSFYYEDVKLKAIKNSNTKEKIEQRKKLYNTEEYKQHFRTVHTSQMKPVNMLFNGEVIKSFISFQEASRYIHDTTAFKGKNKASNIKAVCDGERKSAFGYQWEYK